MRHALRMLRKGGASTIVVVVSLALGIGANTAIFSVGYALLAHPLPYVQAERLVTLRSMNPSHGILWTTAAAANLLDWQAQARSFEAIAGYRWRTIDLVGGDHAERLRGLHVTPEFFRVLDVPVSGHNFDPNDPQRRRSEIILGHGLWQRRFGSDPKMLGALLDVNSINLSHVGPTPSFVVGIAQSDVHFPPLSADFNLGVAGIGDSIDFWLPEVLDPSRRDDGDLDVIARLRAGVSIGQAQTEMDAISRRLAAEHPDTNDGLDVRVTPLREQILGGSRDVLFLLSACTGLVLLIACGNVANLLLARATARQKEVAIRTALGATRLRILRIFLMESTLIAVPAGVIGVGLAYGGLMLFRGLMPPTLPFAREATVRTAVLLFTVGVTAATTLLTAAVPALRVPSARPSDVMKLEGRRSSGGSGHQKMIAMLIGAEVALTLVLLIVTGLLVRSANQLLHMDPGFETRNLLTMTISLPNNKFEWRHNVDFSRQVMRSITSLPEIRDAAVIQGVPLRPGSFLTTFSVDGRADTPVDRASGRLRVVSPGYFRVMRIPVVSGRDFDEHDEVGEVGSLPSVIVNRALAERFWPGQDATGKRVRMSWKQTPSTIIGVVGDVHYEGLEAAGGNEFYLPEGLYPQAAITLLVRTTRDPVPIFPDMLRRILDIDKDAFVSDVKPMTRLMADSLAPRRFSTLLLSIFAVVALVLSLAGIYAVIDQAVAERTVEIAIRSALGASPARVVRVLLTTAFLPAVYGMAAGWIAAFFATRLWSATLFGVAPLDMTTWVAVSAAVLAVSFLASYLPARHAGRLDPNIALRAE